MKRYAQEAELKDLREAFPAYAAVHSHVLQDVLARLDRAFQAFFKRLQRGETPGYPRFQGRHRYHSFTDKEYGNGARVENGQLVLSKIGRIAVRWSPRTLHGTIPATIKTVTIGNEADGWYGCFSCVDVPVQPLPLTDQETGIDVGLKVLLITAQGDVVENPRHYRQAERALQKAQRRVSRRTKGSTRRRKAAQLLAKKHQTVRRQRHDVHPKAARALVRRYEVIDREDVQVATMSGRPAPKPDENGGYLHHGARKKVGLNKSLHDAGWSRFPQILTGKAACAGKRVVAVPPAYTSQDGSGCGARVEKSLSVRTPVCTCCGLTLDRDENAARNIQWAGQALRGVRARAGASNREEPVAL